MNEDDGKHGEDHADYWEQSAFLQTIELIASVYKSELFPVYTKGFTG